MAPEPCDFSQPMDDGQKAACEHVVNMFGAWGTGKLHSSLGEEAWKEEMKNWWNEDIAMDWSGPSCPKFTTRSGLDFEWQLFFDKIGWPNLVPSIFPGAPGSGQVMMAIKTDMQFPGPDMKDGAPVEGTGGKSITGLENIFVWTVSPETGKVCSLKVYWDKVGEMNTTFGEFTE